MILAYSYIRMSTPRQAEGDSLRRQISKSERFCGKHGLAGGIERSNEQSGVMVVMRDLKAASIAIRLACGFIPDAAICSDRGTGTVVEGLLIDKVAQFDENMAMKPIVLSASEIDAITKCARGFAATQKSNPDSKLVRQGKAAYVQACLNAAGYKNLMVYGMAESGGSQDL